MLPGRQGGEGGARSKVQPIGDGEGLKRGRKNKEIRLLKKAKRPAMASRVVRLAAHAGRRGAQPARRQISTRSSLKVIAVRLWLVEFL